MAAQVNGKHPLQARLEKWEETQLDLKMEGYRRTFGAGEPIRRAMELEVVKMTDMTSNILGGTTSIHRDILLNKDATVTWEEIYPDQPQIQKMDFHSELEKRMGF